MDIDLIMIMILMIMITIMIVIIINDEEEEGDKMLGKHGYLAFFCNPSSCSRRTNGCDIVQYINPSSDRDTSCQ